MERLEGLVSKATAELPDLPALQLYHNHHPIHSRGDNIE